MMARDWLGRLCSGGGWSYCALWCNDCRDPRLLVLEESYHEEHSGKIFDKMINQVHVIGQGTIGEVAISGKHRWINFDAICMESSEISSIVNPCIFQGSDEWQNQILAGIKTIAAIPLPSIGVILFGSTQKICESSGFIAQAQHLLHQLLIKQHGYVHLDLNSTHPQATFASVISSLDCSRFKNNVYSVCKQRQHNNLSSECSSLVSGLLSLGSQTSSLKPHASSVSVSTSSASFNGHADNLFYSSTPSFSSTSSQHQAIDQQSALSKARLCLPPINRELYSNFKHPSNLFITTAQSHMRATEIDHFSYMEHQPFPGMAMPGVLSHRKGGSMAMVDTGMSSNNSDAGLSYTGNLLELQHRSSPLVSACDLSTTSKSSSKVSPFTPDPPDTKSTKHHIHDKFMENSIHSCDKTNGQLNNGLAVPAAYGFPNARSASSGMAGNVGTTRTVTAALPSTATESPAACVSSSFGRSRDWNESTSDTRNRLDSDNDLFDGMEFDLSPMISRQECWDDIVFPVVSTSCADLSRLSNCISELEMDSVAGSCKDLFSDSSCFEHLLDAVVAGHANLSTTCNSVGTSTNSAISQESKLHMSTTTKDKEKITDAQPKSHLHTWIDDSCSANAEGSTLHRPKKFEESAKVARKRARPGESTRPRPKDRQQIQDRVKELREIVPNGAKCSIDALLDRTIKHMLFLQSVAKYADKLKQADEPMLIGEENGVILKDNTKGGAGGATWAYEVAGQTMVCPILVEDVHPSGQMLVEMLCEERGFFLEIADIVRGFGLTILKGVMEIRERKMWARYIVEANRDVTRTDIFLSLVQLLQQASSFRSSELLQSKAIAAGITSLTAYQQQSTARIPLVLADMLQ